MCVLIIIFYYDELVHAGLGLKTEEFSKPFQRLWFNLFVQTFGKAESSADILGSRLQKLPGQSSTGTPN